MFKTILKQTAKHDCVFIVHTTYEDGREGSETSVYKIQTPGNRPN